MVTTIVTEVVMDTVKNSAAKPGWVVELNIGGCRISRTARRRRHLLGLRTPVLPPRLRPSGAA
jgi:hypothetical protein